MSETDRDAALMGRIAVKHRFISMDQLAEATRVRGREGKKLGAVLMELGMIDKLQLAKILALQKRYQHQQESNRPAARPRTDVKKIPTPKDWVFENKGETPKPRRKKDAMPRRRGRRTGDAHPLATDAPPTPLPDSRPGGGGRLDRRPQPTPAPDKPTPKSRQRTAPDRIAPREPEMEAPADSLEVELDETPAEPRSATRPATEPAPRRSASEDSDLRTRPTPPSQPAVDSRPPEPALPPSSPPPSSSEEPAPRDTPPVTKPAAASAPAPAPEPAPEPAPPPPVVDEGPRLEPRHDRNAKPSRAVQDLHIFLRAAAEAGGSDVHVHAGLPVKMRQYGRIMAISDRPLKPAATEMVLRDMLTPWQLSVFDEAGEVDFAYVVDGVGRFRANVYRHHRGMNGVFHYVPPHPPTLEDLGLPSTLARLTNYTQGLILVTGPAGCGKTSTLAALVDIINAERHDHILTIEDPVEYVHPSKRCLVNQRQVGRHTTSFARALRGALREDPDIICIGELRDLETISLALSAAETGHLVLATLHTGSSIGTINRIVGAYPPNQQSQVRAMMSESLRAVISQRLVPRADGAGVVPALEILYVNKAVGTYIRDNRTFQIHSVLQTGKAQGMQLLSTALDELVKAGTITAEEAKRHTEGE